MSEIKEGSIVRLKSGGPEMTVTFLDGFNGFASCAWFIDGELKVAKFNILTLEVTRE